MEWILKQRERTTNTHSAGLPTYGGGIPIPCRVNLGYHLVYPSVWLVLLLVRRRRLIDLVLVWRDLGPTSGYASLEPRVSWAQSTLSRAMHLVLCTPLVSNGFLVLGPLSLVPRRETASCRGL